MILWCMIENDVQYSIHTYDLQGGMIYHTYLIEKTVVDNVLKKADELKDAELKNKLIETIVGPRAEKTDIPNSVFINKNTHPALYNKFITEYNKLPRGDVYNKGENVTGLFLPTGTFQLTTKQNYNDHAAYKEESTGGSRRTRTSRKKTRRNIKRRYVSH